MTPEVSSLSLISFFTAIALAAFLPWLFRTAFIPVVVLEILFGFALGPQALGVIEVGPILGLLSDMGLAVLFLMAGFELDPKTISGRPFRLAGRGWFISLLIGLALAYGGAAVGLVPAPAFVGLAIATTAMGALLPILRDSDQLGPPYGPHVLAVGAVGEGFPLVALSLLLAGVAGFSVQGAILLGFALLAVVAITLARHLEKTRFALLLRRTMGTSGQFPLRFALFLMALFVLLGEHFGLDLVLGAFVAGAVARAALPDDLREDLGVRLDGVGYGFLVPCFFIVSGVQLDMAALVASPATLIAVPVFALLMLIARGIPALALYTNELNATERKALALHAGTQLPLVVAITAIAVREGIMPGWCGAALVAAGVLSLVLYPALAGRLLSRDGQTDA